jgi:hypothetical protein
LSQKDAVDIAGKDKATTATVGAEAVCWTNFSKVHQLKRRRKTGTC